MVNMAMVNERQEQDWCKLSATDVWTALEAAEDDPRYGTIEDVSESKHMLSDKKSVSVAAVILAFFIPLLLFAFVYGVLSFSIHYTSPIAAYLLVFIAFLVVYAFGRLAWQQLQKHNHGDTSAEPGWYIYICFSLLLAWLFGVIIGEVNYLKNMRSFYDWGNLNTYAGVNPALNHGEQLMDAGLVVFTKSAQLDITRAMAFVNSDTYCVAPISLGSTKLPQYDFWAVGMNCCKPHSRGGGTITVDYQCGEFNNDKAHGGLRLLADDERRFYSLAVRQAEALHGLRSGMPLFFSWVQDPISEVKNYRRRGYQYYLLGLFAFCALDLMLVGIVTVLIAHKK